jgi:hypothetical protein
MQGVVIRTYRAGPAISEYVIDDVGLKAGLYLVRVNVSGLNSGFKKLIVTRD